MNTCPCQTDTHERGEEWQERETESDDKRSKRPVTVMVVGGWVGGWYWLTSDCVNRHISLLVIVWSCNKHTKMVFINNAWIVHVYKYKTAFSTCLESNFNHVETDFLLVDTSDIHIFQSIEFKCLSNISTYAEWTTFKEKSMWWWRCGEGKEEEEREGANGRLCQQKYTPLAWISGGSSLTSRRRWFLYIQVRITASVTLLYPYTETSQLTSGPREGPRGRIFPPHSLQTVETCLWWRPPDSLSGPQLRQRDRNGCSTIHCDKVSLQLKLLGWTFSLESFVSL